MRVLLATPAAGGMVHYFWNQSCDTSIYAAARLRQQKHYALAKYGVCDDSLVARARNHCAQVMLTGNFDKMVFIDADVSWEWGDLQKLLDSEHDIVGGACPFKSQAVNLNYVPFPEDDKFHPDGLKTPKAMQAMAKEHGKVEVPVAFLGTAFLCITRKVFAELAIVVPSYMGVNPYSGQMEQHWDFFPQGVKFNRYMSEDWGFCYLARDHGFEINLNTEIVVKHWSEARAYDGGISTKPDLVAARLGDEKSIVETVSTKAHETSIAKNLNLAERHIVERAGEHTEHALTVEETAAP